MFVSKNKHIETLKKLNEAETQNECLSNRYDMLYEDYQTQSKEIVELRLQIEKLEEILNRNESIYGDANIVKLTISDDLSQVLPTVTVKSSVFDKMIQLGMISDAVTVEAKPTSMQVAAMVIARDALDQILDNFDDKIEKVD